jgi:hypothetical protein
LPHFKAKVVELEAELAAEQQRSAGHRADYERERADRMVIRWSPLRHGAR